MNLHQSAHGDREFGAIGARLRMERHVVVDWQDAAVQKELGDWSRAACGIADAKTETGLLGDNMREVPLPKAKFPLDPVRLRQWVWCWRFRRLSMKPAMPMLTNWLKNI